MWIKDVYGGFVNSDHCLRFRIEGSERNGFAVNALLQDTSTVQISKMVKSESMCNSYMDDLVNTLNTTNSNASIAAIWATINQLVQAIAQLENSMSIMRSNGAMDKDMR